MTSKYTQNWILKIIRSLFANKFNFLFAIREEWKSEENAKPSVYIL